MTKCTCSYLRIGTKISDTKNLNPDCPLHGTDSVWYNSPEQVKKRDERSQRLRELYDAARKAKENVNETSYGRTTTEIQKDGELK